MSNSIQTFGDIKPMGEKADSAPVDPIQKEYEEGKSFLENKNFGQAAVALHNALVGFEEAKNEIGVANAANQLGNLCLAREDFENSLNHYRRSLEICQKHQDSMSILAVQNSLITVLKRMDDLNGALTTALEILDLQYDNNNPQGVVDIMDEIAELYVAMGKTDKAADTYRTISSIHKNFRHESSAASYLQKAEELMAEE